MGFGDKSENYVNYSEITRNLFPITNERADYEFIRGAGIVSGCSPVSATVFQTVGCPASVSIIRYVVPRGHHFMASWLF